MRFSIARLVHQVMLPVTLVAFMSACHKWSTVEPGQPFAEEGTEDLRITRTDGQWFVLEDAAVVDDSVAGLVAGDSASIALSEVDRIQVRNGDWVGTGVLIGSVVIVGAAIASLVALSAWEGPFSGCCN